MFCLTMQEIPVQRVFDKLCHKLFCAFFEHGVHSLIHLLVSFSIIRQMVVAAESRSTERFVFNVILLPLRFY